MALTKSIVMSAAFLVTATLVANAQPQYPNYPYPYASMAPPAWSYDPYTSGLGPCPQRGPGDLPCWDRIAPTYGQPSYWPRTP
jgi:hypothetical protein